jgi:basic amino acid/polyamine antiporter, APA family
MSTTSHPSSPGLTRVLGPLTATAIVVGTIIGSGVFKKPATIADKLPQSGLVAVVWVAAGLLVLCGALAYAEVAVLFPKTGGNYVFLKEGYGRLFGFLWCWVDFWIIRAGSLAALATIFTESLHDILKTGSGGEVLGFWAQRGVTVGVLLGLGLVNIRGVRWGGGLQVVVTLVKVVSLVGIAVFPFFLLGRVADSTVTTANLDPVWPSAWSAGLLPGVGAAFLGVLWAYHGWQNIAPIAGEVRDPQRNLPIALLGGTLIVVALYLGVNFAYYLTMPAVEMAGLSEDTTVAAESALRWMGPVGKVIVAAAIMLSVFGSLNGNMMVGPRQLFAMGEDGLAPRWLGQVHPRYRTPAASIALLAAWSTLLVLGVAVLTQTSVLASGKSHFDHFTDFAMFGAVLFETLAVVSIFRFRALLPGANRPYRCPGYPITPALYVLLPGFILFYMVQDQRNEVFAGLGFIALGTLVFYAFGLQRVRQATTNE